jgi:hypothetical protein
MGKKEYSIDRIVTKPEMKGLWDGPAWRHVPSLDVAEFRPESSSHRPRTRCKLLYSPHTIHGIFRVEDKYVRCLHNGFQSDVWKDSCVECFLQPNPSRGYFNFEFNCGGAMLASYVTDPTRVAGKVSGTLPFSIEECKAISIYHSLPDVVDPEVPEQTDWRLEFSIPLKLMEAYVGPIAPLRGQAWRANFYKCGNETSHPHWASWSPIEELNFHLPRNFGSITFQTPT